MQLAEQNRVVLRSRSALLPLCNTGKLVIIPLHFMEERFIFTKKIAWYVSIDMSILDLLNAYLTKICALD